MKGRQWFNVFFGVISIFLVGMLYWSLSLIEADIKSIRNTLKELKEDTAHIHQKIRFAANGHPTSETLAQGRSLIDAHYKNLLKEDPFFVETLPKLIGDNFRPHGVLKKACMGRPDHLHPFHGFRDVSELHSLCSIRLAELNFGKYETLSPQMALKIEARPRKGMPEVAEYWVHLRDDVTWTPLNKAHFPDDLSLDAHFLKKHPVTAYDFKFYLDALMNPYLSESGAVAQRTYFEDIEELEVIDPYTFVVRWKPEWITDAEGERTAKLKYTALSLTGSLTPLPSFVFQYFVDGQKIIDEENDPHIYRKSSIWAQNFSQHFAKNVIVSCGAYLFDGMDDEGIHLKRNPDYFNYYAALVDGIHYTFKESVDAIWQDFKAGKIDICTLSPRQLLEYEEFLNSSEYKEQKLHNQAISAIDYVELSYYYLGWNLTKPHFSNGNLRRALTLAIDRNRIIEQNLNHMAVTITGPFFCYSSANDSSIDPWPFNPQEARRLLKEAGWEDHDGDGIRDQMINGTNVAFRFKLTYFVKSLSSKVIAEYIATALREVGVDCQLCGLDLADLSRQFEDKSFDAILMGWKLGTPPEDPRQLWHSLGAKEKGSSNAIGFRDPECDRIIETLHYEANPEKRKTLYHALHKILHQEVPYTFLYTPKVRLLYRERVQNVFVPRERQDLVPGADISEPNTQLIWLKT